MIMNVKKQLWSLARMVLPAVGFVLTCTGAYLVSLQNEYESTWRIILVHIMIAFGFLAMLIGVFWSICHSIKSKIYQRGGREEHIQVFTIERPSFFPPSYEESQEYHVCPDTPLEIVDTVISLAPPLYSQDSSEVSDCACSWEQPPPYSQMDTEEHREALSGH